MNELRWNTKIVPDGTETGKIIRVLEYLDGADWLEVPEIDSRPMAQPVTEIDTRQESLIPYLDESLNQAFKPQDYPAQKS